MTTNSGFIIQPEIAIPAEATKINVSADGIISVQVPGQVEAQEVGQLQLADFQNREDWNQSVKTFMLKPLQVAHLSWKTHLQPVW